MAQYKIIIDKEDLHQLFNQDQGMAKLVEKVLNKVLEAEVAERSCRPGPMSAVKAARATVTATGSGR